MNKAARWRAEAIYEYIKDIPKPVVAELGVFTAAMSQELVQLKPDIQFHLIDKWPSGDETPQAYKDTKDFHSNMTKEKQQGYYDRVKEWASKHPNVKLYREWTHEAVNNFEDGYFDLVFIDADHSYEGCMRDIKDWLPKVKEGGTISGHDYENDNGQWEFGVTKAVDEWAKESKKRIKKGQNFTWFAEV